MKITDDMMKKTDMLGGACEKQRDLFRKMWPDGAEITKENVKKARDQHLDIGWLATRLIALGEWRVLTKLVAVAKLRRLYFDNTRVTSRNLVRIKDLTELTGLYLRNTQITDAGLVHLKGLIGLWELDLSFTHVTDVGLTHLKGLTALRELDIRGTEVTDEGVAGLKLAVPKLCVYR